MLFLAEEGILFFKKDRKVKKVVGEISYGVNSLKPSPKRGL